MANHKLCQLCNTWTWATATGRWYKANGNGNGNRIPCWPIGYTYTICGSPKVAGGSVSSLRPWPHLTFALPLLLLNNCEKIARENVTIKWI